MNRVGYPVKIMPKQVAIYSQQFNHSDHTQNKIELHRLSQRKIEAQNLTEDLQRDELATVNFHDFINK